MSKEQYNIVKKINGNNMKICRGFHNGGTPVEVLYVENSSDVQMIDGKIQGANGKSAIIMKVDNPENIVILKKIAKSYQSNDNVWLGIKIEEGFEEVKIEKLLKAYEAIREETKATIVVEAIRTDGACGRMLVGKKELENVIFSVLFEKKKDVNDSVKGHLAKLEQVKSGCNLPTITYFPKSHKAPVGGCTACQAPGLDEMKMIIEGLKADDEEKKRLLRALSMMPAKAEVITIDDEEYIRAMLKALNDSGNSWYTEEESAFFEGCFREAS